MGLVTYGGTGLRDISAKWVWETTHLPLRETTRSNSPSPLRIDTCLSSAASTISSRSVQRALVMRFAWTAATSYLSPVLREDHVGEI